MPFGTEVNWYECKSLKKESHIRGINTWKHKCTNKWKTKEIYKRKFNGLTHFYDLISLYSSQKDFFYDIPYRQVV